MTIIVGYTKTRIDELNERCTIILANNSFKTDMNRNLMILNKALSEVDNELEEIASK